jgi:hypothetical protein
MTLLQALLRLSDVAKAWTDRKGEVGRDFDAVGIVVEARVRSVK